MFKRVNFKSLRVVLSVLFLVSATTVYAQSSSDSNGNQWYICEIKSKQKANEKKYFGPYATKEETLANWMYRNLPENKKYCVALKLTYMTATPSSYFGREWKAVKEDYDFDRDYFIKKYGIALDDKIEAAYLKSQGIKAPKAEKSSKKEKEVKAEKEKKSKKDKNTEAATVPVTTVNTINDSNLSDTEKAKENAKLAANQAKEAAKAAEEAIKLEEAKAKGYKKTKVANDNVDALLKAKEVEAENKNKAKEAENLSKNNGKDDGSSLSSAIDEYYKNEKNKKSSKKAKKETTEKEPVKAEPAATVVPAKDEKVTHEEIESFEEPASSEIEVPAEYENAEVKDEAKILVDDNAAGKNAETTPKEEVAIEETAVQEEPAVEETPIFTFTSTQSNVSRYKKEYLQDYIPQDSYVPQSENNFKQRIENPNDADAKGQTLLMKAAKAGNDWQIKTLLESGANVNLKDNEGWTALMYACRYQESISTLKTLIEAGAIVKEKNNYETSPLMLAATYNDNPEILSYLLKYYSNSEKEVLKCFILLLSSHQPSEYLQIAKVNIFMEKSIPLNTFYQGKTPLMYAAQYGNSTKTLKLLLDNDALTTIRSSEGKTAFDYAAKNSSLVHDENYWALNKK